MATDRIVNVSRRQFLKVGLAAGTGLTLGVYLPTLRSAGAAAGPGKAGGAMFKAGTFEPNAFVSIGADNSVTVIAKHLEMGQGTYTGLATLVAEELDAAWSQITVKPAPADANRYNNLLWGSTQGTGGSTAIANSFVQMRKAGAAAREMLVGAAAEQWGVSTSDVTVRDGIVRHQATERSVTFGELAERAGRQPVPVEPFLKDPSEFRLIGSHVPRKDSRDKTHGTAIFTQDIQLPGMLTALVAHPPRFGATVKSLDASATKRVKGVTDVVQIPTGVAVLAKDFWSAKRGRDVLRVDWDESKAFTLGTDEILTEYRALSKNPGAVARKEGDTDQAMARAARVIEADYVFPYLAHAALEPMNCVIKVSGDGCEVWNGEQFQTPDQMAVANVLGLKPEHVKINMLYAGGSFGRRANPQSDYVVEAANIVKAIQGKAPVKLVWTREDDMRAGYYRPMYFHRMKAGLDDAGDIIAWQHRIVGQSIIAGTAFEASLAQDGIDQTSVEGAANVPYAVPNITVDLHSPKLPVPVQWWRSVGSTHTAFAVETFIDELAVAARRDPVVLRRTLLKNHPRHRGVVGLAAEKSRWGETLPPNRGRGIAVHESFNSYVAQVADVSVDKDGSYSVDRVVVAVDCGIAVNPDIIRAQMEGGLGFGLSAALSSQITLNAGRVVQSNFHDYTVLRMSEMPDVEVHIVQSTESPTGVGEPATPVIAPAVANALAAATGKRFYELPLLVTG